MRKSLVVATQLALALVNILAVEFTMRPAGAAPGKRWFQFGPDLGEFPAGAR